MGEMINPHKILAGKPDGNRPLGIHWRRFRIILKRILVK
jgi:hypothetical protein